MGILDVKNVHALHIHTIDLPLAVLYVRVCMYVCIAYYNHLWDTCGTGNIEVAFLGRSK